MTVDPAASTAENGSWADVLRAIWRFLGDNRKSYVVCHLILFGILFYELVPPFIVGRVVDFFSAYKPGDALTPFYGYTIFIGASYVIVSYLRLGCKAVLNRIFIAAKAMARVQGFERLMGFSLQWHARENSGNKMQRIFTGSDSIPEWGYLFQNSLFPVAANFVGVLAVFLFLSPIFTAFLLLYMAIFFAVERFFNRKLRALSDRVNQIRENSSGRYAEGTGNILAIKALGAEKGVSARMGGSEEAFKDVQIQMSNLGISKWRYFQTINGIATGVFLWLVGRQYLAHAITVGDILVFFTYFRTMREAASQATDISAKTIQMRSDILRMMPIFLENMPVKAGHDKFPSSWEAISIHQGTFSYPGGHGGLKDLDFTVRRGEKVGIAGASGSGKSTLAKVLLGLYALDSGTFTVDGKDYYTISHDAVMDNIGIVLQETELFNLSLLENLTLSRDVSPELLQAAIDIAQLGPVIERLPEGINTFVGERGYALSGGERQRIGIARAICKNAPILLLDEATSALDARTEKAVMDGLLAHLDADKTCIIVSHRIQTLRGTDRVLVFDRGAVREEGSYAHLIEDKTSHLGQLHVLQTEG